MKFSAIITFALISLTAAQSFQEQNANDAEKLQEDFKKLTPDSPCEDGEQACVQDQFAQCVGGKFALNSCGGGELKCVVLPLVNKPGTSITCSTEQDRLNRLDAARGGKSPQEPKGNDKGNNIETPESGPEPENGKNNEKDQPPESDDEQPKQPKQPSKSPESGKDNESDPKIFRPQNADDAEKLQEDFKTLTPDSPCEDGDQACVQDQFAQCVGGKFALNPCGGGELKCVVLPLVNKPGTSITCSTEQDRLNRLAEARGETPSESGKDKDNNEQPPPENGKGEDNNVNQPDPKSPENKDDNEQPSDDNKDDNEQPSDDNKDDNEQPEDGEENNANPKQPQPDSAAEIRKKNAEEAEKLQEEFKSFTPDQPCTNNEVACVDDKLAQCANGKFALTECGPGLQCSVLPLVLKEGTTVTCTTEADRIARIKEAKNNLK